MKTPIFIISLPRSGSTMLQRILSTSSNISTHSEPWILLPHLYALKNSGQLTDYAYFNYVTAREDFISQLPKGREDFVTSLRDFGMSLYEKCCKDGEDYYLDKTPRYYHIIEELHEVFPNAKFIYLFRNPLAIYGSLITTFCQNKLLKLFNFFTDINEGVYVTHNAYIKNQQLSLRVYYEDLVEFPEMQIKRISKYLGIEASEFDLDSLASVQFQGKFGDPTGIRQYSKIALSSREKWKSTFNNPFRFLLARQYIKKTSSLLDEMGYESDDLKKQLKFKLGNPQKIVQDIIFYSMAVIIEKFKPNIHFGKVKSWASNKFLS